ncbi:MAG: hypothetical protein AAF902_16990 [Chloroflexota bacterium]
MKKFVGRKIWAIGFTAFVLFSLFFIGTSQDSASNSFQALLAPAFVSSASAAPANEVLVKIQDEAGMSAYFKSSSPVSISSVKSEFETIEIETNDYILGTVRISGYPEDHAPHVYVHKDGWFMAYYFADDPSGKIIDWKAYTASDDTVISTKLENILVSVAGAAGVGLNEIVHYDFRYPNATTMMFIVERSEGTGNNYFTLNIPSSFGVAERSYSTSIGSTWAGAGQVRLNGVTLVQYSTGNHFDIISASQLAPNTDHTFSISGGETSNVAGLILIYTE